MSRQMTIQRAAVGLLLALALAAACGGQPPGAGETPTTPTGAATATPAQPTPQAVAALTPDQICARIQLGAAQQATGDPWKQSAVVGTPPSCDFTDDGDDRLSIATTTYPSKQVADMAWTVGFPGKPQTVNGLGRQAVFMTVDKLTGDGTQGQLYIRTDDTDQYQIRLLSAKIGSNAGALLDACQKVGRLLVSP